MKTSAQGLELLLGREGSRKRAYLDTKGIPTIGVGHTGPEVYLGLEWTNDQIREALEQDAGECEECIAKHCVSPLSQNQFDALVSFIFNIGVDAFRRSTMLKKLNQADYDGAAKEFNRWNIPSEIISRRMGEKAQFMGTEFKARL